MNIVSTAISAITDTNGQKSQQSMATPSADTLAAKEKTPPTVTELKEALRAGTAIQGLNPHSKEFTPVMIASDPSGGTALNPNSAEFVPSGPPPSAYSTKYQPTQPSASSRLYPKTQEIVPGALNPTASDFIPEQGVPVLMQNGDLEPLERGDGQAPIGEEGVALLETVDILNGFERVHPEDTSGEPLLMASAEMLVKATVYPGSYDRLLLNLDTAIKPKPSEASLTNLAEMIVHWVSNLVSHYVTAFYLKYRVHT